MYCIFLFGDIPLTGLEAGDMTTGDEGAECLEMAGEDGEECLTAGDEGEECLIVGEESLTVVGVTE